MQQPTWTDKTIRERVRTRTEHYEQRGATLMAAQALAWGDVCIELYEDFKVLRNRVAELEQQIASENQESH